MIGTLPFSPLTRDEIRDRFEEARNMCGYRCMSVAAMGVPFEDYDLDALRAYGEEAEMYAEAREARSR